MEMILAPSETRRHMVVNNETTNGVMFNFVSTIAESSEDIMPNLDDFRVRIAERLDGKETNIVFDGTMLEIYAVGYANNFPMANKTFFKAREIGGNRTFQLPFSFGTNYNLKDGNELFVECTNKKLKDKAGTFVDNTLVVETIPSIGLKSFIPLFESRALEGTLEKHDLNLGSSVHQVIYLAPDGKSGEFDVARLKYKSDKLNEELSANNLYAQLSNTVEPDQDYAGTPIYLLNSLEPLHKLNVKLDFLSALSNRRLIIVRKVQTPEVINKYITKQAAHAQENLMAVKSGLTAEGCLCATAKS
ncbi:hypothetical protein [Flavobacterium microcysteis]|uniref:Uncharacterized protein n=1 Tax=Flavobacterium microcysteis TaxID=2596891 RepID=A0A501QCB5_9FLAO|nr:hypothetical protein [Flavobacterium microcysteis]TPD70499.1 hypothetical protein FJA49_06065 [Flavobacterium microcysteis]